jgi:hypothetical protein
MIQSTTTTAPARGEAPQTVYEKKKTIFRFSQVVWYILGVVEVLLGFRFLLKMLAANAATGFVSFIYMVTGPLVAPFRGIFPTPVSGGSVFEWSTIVAVLVYICIAWGLVYLLDLLYPITPNDVEVQ